MELPEHKSLTEEQRQQFENMIKPFENAYATFIKMSPSIRKAFMASYFFGTKTEKGKQKKFNKIVERLNLDLTPMESIKKKKIK